MASGVLFTGDKYQSFKSDGTINAGGTLTFYSPGTTTLKTVYADQGLATPITNPVTLDSAGRATVFIDGTNYDLYVKDSTGTLIYSQLNVYTPPTASATMAEWTGNSGDSATSYAGTQVSATSFTVSTDVTAYFQSYRRIKIIQGGTTLYGYITSSSYGAPNTTVNVTLDSGSIPAGSITVYLSLLSGSNPSIPPHYPTGFAVEGGINYASSAGTDTYTATVAPAITGYVTGAEYSIIIGNANATTSSTLNLNGLGAKNIKRDGTGTIKVGDMPAGHCARFRYDGTNMVLLNPSKAHSYVKFSDVKASGTDGGGLTSAGWRQRDINTKDSDDDGIGSVAVNQITLAAGTYECDITVPGYAVDQNRARLQNITGAATLLFGTSVFAGNAGGGFSVSQIKGKFILSVQSTLQIQHWGTTTVGNGCGRATTTGDSEIYTTATFIKVA